MTNSAQQNPLPGTRPKGAEAEAAAAATINRMFAALAPRYDFLNHLLSFGFDRRWRRRTAARLGTALAPAGARALDLCAGTGDLALEIARVTPGKVWASDFCHPMLQLAQAKARRDSSRVQLLGADALCLPFADGTFDVVSAAFGFRNLANYRRGLEEIRRVLKPGGIAAILEFSLPQGALVRGIYRFYFRRILPRLGNWLSGVPGAYSYLPASVELFPDCDEFAEWMRTAGFGEVRYERWTAGTVALHTGIRLGGT